MKTWLLAVMMMIMGIAVNAQPGEGRHEWKEGHREQFTPEQRAELQVKKMTLALDLSDKQQATIKAFLLERNKENEKMKAEFKANREAGKKLTTDERFAMKSKMLDNQITMKAFMKKTLDPLQLAKLQEIKNKRVE